MSATANQAICELYHRTVYDIRAFNQNRKEMDSLRDSYFRYTECARIDLALRDTIRCRYGLMGVHFPSEFVSPETAEKLSPLNKTSSAAVRKTLKLWEILEEFLGVVGGASYTQFCSYLSELKFDEPSPQAVNSAIRTHPDLFVEKTEGSNRVISLIAGS